MSPTVHLDGSTGAKVERFVAAVERGAEALTRLARAAESAVAVVRQVADALEDADPDAPPTPKR